MTPSARAGGNPFGLAEALFGLAAGFLLSLLAVSAYAGIAHVPATSETTAETVISLVALWIGLIGAVALASRLRRPAGGGEVAGPSLGSLRFDYGFAIRPWPDLPLGVAVGLAGQFLLVPVLELPLEPFVHHLSQRLGHPTRELLGPAASGGTATLVLISVLVCVGSPLVEELFFRGLVLRALLFRFRTLGRVAGPALSIVTTGIVFGLVHFEELQLLALSGFGVVLGLLAWWSGRLGPSIVAHVAFNSSTVIAYVLTH